MISIIVKYQVKPEYADQWVARTREFTEAVRAEPGNKWFEWSRDVEDPNQFVLIEGFEDDTAEAHVNSEHFKKGLEVMGEMVAETPKIISRQVEGDDWDEMAELKK